MNPWSSHFFRALSTLPLLATCFCTMSQPVHAQTKLSLPDTPASKQFVKWLTAFNSGNTDTLRRFIAESFDAAPDGRVPVDAIADPQSRLFKTTGGLEPYKVTESTSAVIGVLAKAKRTGFWMEVKLFIGAEPPDYVTAKAPYRLVGIGLGDRDAPVELLPRKRLTEKEIHDNLDRLMKVLVGADAFSGSVYVAKHGKPVYAKAFGLASRAWNVPNRVDTRFHLASITKMFTAVAVAQLVERGKLTYTDTVGTILPDYPNKEVAEKVTVHHLLSHTSGMINARALVEKEPHSPTFRTIAEKLKPFSAEPLAFRPGQQFDYSNAGYILLGAVIEKASGKSYFDYIRENIFKPAGMRSTDFYELDSDPPNVATGYKDGPNGTRRNNVFDLEIIGSPAGGAYSTGNDMTRFHTALMNLTLINENSLKTLWTGVTENPEQFTEYGYGAQINYYNGTRIVGHGGGWQGITNQFDMYPDLGYTVVILGNTDSEPRSIANKLHEWLTQGTSPRQAESPMPPRLTFSAEVSSQSARVGVPVTIKVTVNNSGGVAHASVIDMEIKDAGGGQANQQYTLDQKIEAGQSRTYTYSWTPSVAGKYTLDIGAFGPRWTPKYLFENAVATIHVE